ncbi:hypothetical protein BDQ17DRAFT_1253909, partial [Cyathus striatus]
ATTPGNYMSHSAHNYSYSAPRYPPPQGHMHKSSTSTIVGGGPDPKDVEEARGMDRTPSPTPSEARELSQGGAIDWKSMRNWSYWIRKEWWLYYIIFVVILALSILMLVYHTQIVHWLTPAINWMHNLKFGWLIPIGIIFVISFPPLFGHDIVAILCGLVWGLGPGFAIVAAGTFIGEIGNYYASKYACHSRSEKTEKSSIFYACLAQVLREGGFKIALIARYSVVPAHYTTTVFASCGMGISTFCLAAFLSLPKQLVTVYMGVLLEESSKGTVDKKSKVISDLVTIVTTVITFIAMWYILKQMNHAKPDVIYKRRKARYITFSFLLISSHSSCVFNPNHSDLGVPLQQWDAQGRALGYAQDPNIYAPRQQRSQGLGVTRFSEELDQPTSIEEDEVRLNVPQRRNASGWHVRPTLRF